MARPRPIAVFYEHPHWFEPLFRELERRDVPHVRLDAARHAFDPSAPLLASGTVPLLFNRMSPSAWTRGRADAIAYTADLLAHVEAFSGPAINGSRAFSFETSKSRQVSLLERLGISTPRTRVVHSPAALPDAARALEFPLVVKPNVGGSGAGITRYDRAADLERAVREDVVIRGFDGTLLLQEYHPPRDDSIVRVETLDGKYLYGIRIHLAENAGFDLCPADVCKTTDGRELSSPACPTGAAKAGLTVEAFEPPVHAVRSVERIVAAAGIDVGGVEYLESARDGRRYYYDVNALSNFVADPVRVVGFDPTERLVDFLLERAAVADPVYAAGGGVAP